MPIFLLTLFCLLSWPVAARTQESNLLLPGDVNLTVQGDDFIFEQIYVDIDGEQVLQERAIWDGNVIAEFQDVKLETEHIEALFDGDQVSMLEAGPQVVVTGFGGKAHFECSDMVIDFPTSEADAGIYTGFCNNVRGSVTASPADFGYEITDVYEINFVADTAELGPETAILSRPILSLGNIDDPDFALLSRSIQLDIGTHPGTDTRVILKLEAETLSISVFGNRLNLVPFPLRRSFQRTTEPGFTYPFPAMGIESDAGFHIQPAVAYDFVLDSFEMGPQLIFALDFFPADRSYPELRLEGEAGGLVGEIRAGYRREEDDRGYTVPTRAEPEIILGTTLNQVGNSDFNYELRSFWGHIRDMTWGTNLDRWGYGAALNYSGVEYNNFTLTGFLDFNDKFYENGLNYSTLEGQVRLRYVDQPHWGASLSYRRISDWGNTPFRFDIPEYMEQVGLRQQTRFSRRWGAGFNLEWDLRLDELARNEYNVTYILDSFQMSLGWDFEDSTVSVFFDLPGSLR